MTRPVPRAQWLLLPALVWYVALFTDFQFDMTRPVPLGQVYSDMLRRLLHFDPTISPAVIGYEAFTHDGHTYTYFGVLPTLLRLPALLIGRLDGVEFGWWSCTTAVAIWLWAMLRTLDDVEARLPAAHRLPMLQWAMRIAIVLSGPIVYLLSDATIYNETVMWASALAALFNMLALRAATGDGRPTPGQLLCLATLAGLGLHARASIGVAMCIGTGLLGLRAIWLASRGSERWVALQRLLPAAGVFLAFGLAAAAINDARWGSPFRFADYHAYAILMRVPNGHDLVARFGEIDISRVWFTLLYYITGIAYFLQSVPALADWITARFWLIQSPPAAEVLLWPLQLVLAWLGLCRVWRAADLPRGGTVTAIFVLIGHAIAAFVVLCYYAATLRYRADFAPLVMFACFLGYPVVAARIAACDARLRTRWLAGALAFALLGATVSHYTTALNKITTRSEPMAIRQAWLVLAPFAASSLTRP
jgi:hypothetical protein